MTQLTVVFQQVGAKPNQEWRAIARDSRGQIFDVIEMRNEASLRALIEFRWPGCMYDNAKIDSYGVTK